jgi:hypothetical protein
MPTGVSVVMTRPTLAMAAPVVILAAVLMAIFVSAASALSAIALVPAVLVGFRPSCASCSENVRPATPDKEHHCTKRKPCGSRKDRFLLALPTLRDC